jgi:hypothetical protein
MELFLNLCWLSLLLPAWLLWRQRHFSPDLESPAGTPLGRPHVFICALGCAIILLFPVISATDDLHAMRPEMEESERALRHAGHCGCTIHALHHSSQSVLLREASLTPTFEQMGTLLPFVPQTPGTSSSPAPAGRAPPFDQPASV